MGIHDARRIAAAKTALEGLTGEADLPPQIARVFSRGLIKDWVEGDVSWRPEWSRQCLDKAMLLVQAARVLDELHEEDAALPAWRRAGELLEWLSRANDDLRTEVPLALLAGAAFQLGQLPAMSAALLQRAEVKAWESPIHAAFLAGDLTEVLDLVVSFWAERVEHTGTQGSARLLEDGETIASFAVHELVRCLGLIAGALRDDNRERSARGLMKLEALNTYAQSTADAGTALLIDLEYAVAQRYVRRSIYVGLAPLTQPGSPASTAALDRFARGLVADGKALMWPSQERGVERLATGESFAICTPTGSGKTLVALLAVLIETLAAAPQTSGVPQPLGRLALYLVPSRALAMEVEREARERLGPCGVIVSSLYGEADWGAEDLDLQGPAPRMLVSTVEKAEAIWRLAGQELEARLRLLVVDEAHQVVLRGTSPEQQGRLASGEDRALRLESFVSRLLSRRRDMRRVAVSAVAGDAEPLLAGWLGSAGSLPISPPGRSVRQVVGRLELVGEKYRVTIDRYNGVQPSGVEASRFLALNIPTVPSASPKGLTDAAYATVDAMSVWCGIHLAIRKRRVLIAVGSKLSASLNRALTALNSRAWKEAWRALGTGPHPWFDSPTGEKLDLYSKALAALDSYMGPGSQDAQLLRKGVAAHHGQLPDVPRRLVTSLIQQGVVRVVIATSTLSEGVNLPFDIVIMPVAGRRRTQKVGNQYRQRLEPYSAEEFGNLAGRAGRPGMGRSMEGLTVVAMPPIQHTHELKTAYNEVLMRLNGPTDDGQAVASPLAALMNWVKQLAEEAGVTADAFPHWLEEVSPRNLEGPILDAVDALDQVILSAVAEAESIANRALSAAELETCLQALWSATFASAAAEVEERLGKILQLRVTGVVREYSERGERRRLYMLGLPPARGRRFLSTAARLEEYMRGGAGFEGMDEEARGAWLTGLIDLVRPDPALGFKDPGDLVGRREVQLAWKHHLSWWLGLNSTFPTGEELNNVLKFVMEQFDFRTGVAVSAVLADVWERLGTTSGATDADVWHETTGLPWVCYWVRDLLRYGTISPVRAHLLAHQRAVSRAQAKEYELMFLNWLADEGHDDPDDSLHPDRIREWERSVFADDGSVVAPDVDHVELDVDEQFRGYAGRLMAWPVVGPTETVWFEPGGYRIGRSARVDAAGDPAWRKRAFCGVNPTEGTVRWRKL